MLNRIILMGRLCADPEFRQTQSNIPVCRFRIAVNRQKDKNGNQEADFINCTAWRSTAEFVARYFGKGSMIIIEGQLRNNDYTDNNGVKHYSMDVLAESVEFGESKNAQNAQNGGATQQGQAPQQYQQYGVPQQQYQQQYQQPQQYGAALQHFDTLPPPQGNPYQPR